MTQAEQVGRSWVAYAAALWALLFAIVHIVWAAGWYVGLPEEETRKAFARPLFLAYDLVVAGVCALAVPVALAPVRPWGRRLPRRLIGFLAWTGTGLLVVRAGGSLAQLVRMVVKGTFVPHPMDLWEVWFYIGAVLFSLSTWRFWRASSAAARALAGGQGETS